MFGLPAHFLEVVRAGYPAVYRAASFAFLVGLRAGGELVQGMHLTDAAGDLWLATSRLERQADGHWRIDGCDVEPAPGTRA